MLIQPGVSIGLSPERGSVGLVLTDPSKGTQFALSCSHVLAESGIAAVGSPIVSNGGGIDAGSYVRIGALSQFFTRLMTSTPNVADFAACTLDLDAGITISDEIPGFGKPSAVSRLTALQFSTYSHTPVKRVGAATGPQDGVVIGWPGKAVGFSGLAGVQGTVGNLNTVIYETSDCDFGDSGAAVVTLSGEVLGIHLGGISSQRLGYFCPVGQTLAQWNLSLA